MIPPRRVTKRTNTNLVANRAMSVMFKAIQWKPAPITLEEIRELVQLKAWEKLVR